jgi:hypothetical protein
MDLGVHLGEGGERDPLGFVTQGGSDIEPGVSIAAEKSGGVFADARSGCDSLGSALFAVASRGWNGAMVPAVFRQADEPIPTQGGGAWQTTMGS